MSAILLAGLALATPRLSGLYDLGALSVLDDVPAAERGFAWRPHASMSTSCGPAKAPDGLGVMEAEALAGGLSSALVILVTRPPGSLPPGSGAPGPESLRVALGEGEPQVLLQPMVDPRHLAVRVQGEATARHQQIVRTQLAMELCMEHKVGRSWTGRDAASLRQAFLLDPPDGGRPDRKSFGGQRDPVPALLGPADACLLGAAEGAREASGRGEGSLDLVPSDVWGASLRSCGPEERPGAPVGEDRRLPLVLEDGAAPRAPQRWSELTLTLGPAGSDEDVRVDLSLDGETLLADEPLFPEAGEAPRGLLDLLARVPRSFPTLQSGGEELVVLIVPAWQIEEALARLEAGQPDQPRPRALAETRAALASVLSRPDRLFVQVREGEDRWLNLSAGLGGAGLGPRDWGFTAGLMSSRSPVVIVGPAGPGEQTGLLAHRALAQAVTLGAGAVVLLALLLGLRRLPELWTPVPRERADYWPGQSGPTPTPGADSPSSPDPSVVPEGE